MKSMLSRLIAAAVVVTCLSAGSWAQAQQPTLADIARQRRAEKAAKKVITSEDMKTAELPAAPAAEPVAATGEAAMPNDEPLAAAQAKVDDLTDRSGFLQRNIARFQESIAQATAANNDNQKKMFEESLEAARQNLEATNQALAEAQKELDGRKAAAAAAAATAAAKAKKRPARKPAAPKS